MWGETLPQEIMEDQEQEEVAVIIDSSEEEVHLW